MSEDEIVGQHHWFNGQELGQTPRESERQRGLACCSPWVAKSWTGSSDWTTKYLGYEARWNQFFKRYKSRKAGDYRLYETSTFRVWVERGKPAKKPDKEKSMRYRKETRRAWIRARQGSACTRECQILLRLNRRKKEEFIMRLEGRSKSCSSEMVGTKKTLKWKGEEEQGNSE